MTSNGIEWVSACKMAHATPPTFMCAICLTGPNPIGWSRGASYPVQEGTFLGNLFASPLTASYCGGGFGINVPGRIGDDGQKTFPYMVLRVRWAARPAATTCPPATPPVTATTPVTPSAATPSRWRGQFVAPVGAPNGCSPILCPGNVENTGTRSCSPPLD